MTRNAFGDGQKSQWKKQADNNFNNIYLEERFSHKGGFFFLVLLYKIIYNKN